MTKLFPIVTVLACLITSYASADEGALKLPSDNRIKFLKYDDTDVYTITTRYGYQTNVVFGRGEEIQTVSVGDRSLWQIIPANNRLFIRPMEENVSTNMTVLTNKHSYQFDLKSIGEDKTGNFYVAKFLYPGDTQTNAPSSPDTEPSPPVVPPPAAPAEAKHTPITPVAPAPSTAPASNTTEPSPEADTEPTENLNYKYTYSGPDNLAPLQAYDDGETTFLRPRNIDQVLPNAYVVGTDGTETPVYYRIRDGLMEIDTIAPEMALKSNAGTVYIFNESLNPQQ